MNQTTIRAANFLGDIGAATHIAYTDGGYANLANVQADLTYLGVKEVRDGISNGENGSAPLASYIQLAKAGEKFTFVVGGGTSTTASIQYTLNTIRQLVAAVPSSVLAIEGPNEINNQTLTFNGVGGLQGAVSLQQYLYSTVKADPALKGVAVDYFTGYDTIGFATGPNPSTTAGLADYDTQHPYPNDGQAPASWVNPSQALGNEPGTRGQFVYTETGYTTNAADANGVDASVQGKYTLDLLMDTAKDGASKTFLYQLMDAYKPGSPQGDDGYGLFDANNAPKSAAVGLHDLAAILADPGATASTFAPTPLAYSVAGLPATGNSLTIAKSDGTTDIAVWAEPTLWNETSKSEVAAPTETVTVNLAGAHAVSVYDPLVGTNPIVTYFHAASVHLAVTDHPLIVQVGAAVAANPPTKIGTGLDKLVLAISEGAYNGDAQYTVSVDGKQVGGTLTATANHAASQADKLTIKGNWASGAHDLAFTLLSDTSAGIDAAVPNLCVDGVTFDGQTISERSTIVLPNNTSHLGFTK